MLLLLGCGIAHAQDIKTPKISVLPVDWETALVALNRVEAAGKLPADSGSNVLVRLNRTTAADFPNIAASPVPVLLPFSLDAYLRHKAGEKADYLSGFPSLKFFLAGPAGYDAVFTVARAGARRDTEIHVNGFALLYELDERVGGEEKPPTGLQSDFPGIRRFYFEHHMRYLFTRYGVLYHVSIECFDGSTRSSSRRLSCNDAHVIASRFLKALAIVGGKPQPIPAAAAAPEARMEKKSKAFSYYPPGHLIPGTSARKRGGDQDYTVYSDIRFPLADAPVQTYSQMFINIGDCTAMPGDSRTLRRQGKPFRCIPGKLIAAASMPSGGQNLYPWRDSFCEARAYLVGQCPSGLGHQGQDIVPVGCAVSSDSDECDRSHHRIVAVQDGTVLRGSKQESLIIVANEPGAHLRFRYLHMNPKIIDDGGFFSGRAVRQGEIIGKVGNFSGREGGTSYHLHFDMQVPTKDGWVWVNPYMTLVTSYERLIGARGTEIPEDAGQASSATVQAASIPAEYTPLHANTRKGLKKKRRTAAKTNRSRK